MGDKQTTFREVQVRKTGKDYDCMKTVITPEGTRKCKKSADYIILDRDNNMVIPFCSTHTKDTWKEMAEE